MQMLTLSYVIIENQYQTCSHNDFCLFAEHKLITFAFTLAWPIFFCRTDDNHCDRIHSSLTGVHSFHNGYVQKQPVAWKEFCVENWLTFATQA